MAVLGPRFCARAFSNCGKWGPLLIAVHRPPIIAASLVAEHRLQTRRLSNCGSRAQSLRGIRDPPRPGLEPVSPALAGRLSTTAPPGKPPSFFKKMIYFTAVLVLQQNWEEGTEIFHILPALTHAQPPPLPTLLTRKVHFLPRMNLLWHIIITQSP